MLGGVLLNKHFVIGSAKKFPDLVFYNVNKHQYVIIDLKCSYRTTDLCRARSQMLTYQAACTGSLDDHFQSQTVGLILGKVAING